MQPLQARLSSTSIQRLILSGKVPSATDLLLLKAASLALGFEVTGQGGGCIIVNTNVEHLGKVFTGFQLDPHVGFEGPVRLREATFANHLLDYCEVPPQL